MSPRCHLLFLKTNAQQISFKFSAERGLRQGFPLSLLLFILVIEGLSRLILKEKVDGKLNDIKINGGLTITHLMFVDDIMILGSGSVVECGFILIL